MTMGADPAFTDPVTVPRRAGKIVLAGRVVVAVAAVIGAAGAIGATPAGGTAIVVTVFIVTGAVLVLAAQLVGVRQVRRVLAVAGDRSAVVERLGRLWTPPGWSVLLTFMGFIAAGLSAEVPVAVNPAGFAVAVLAVVSMVLDVVTGRWTYALGRALFPDSGTRRLTPGAGRDLRRAFRTEIGGAAFAVLVAAVVIATSLGDASPLETVTTAALLVIALALAAAGILRSRAIAGDVLDTSAWRRSAAVGTGVALAAAAAAVLAASLVHPVTSGLLVQGARLGVAALLLALAVNLVLGSGLVHRGVFASSRPA